MKETVAWIATKPKATPCNGNASCYTADEPRETKKSRGKGIRSEVEKDTVAWIAAQHRATP